MKRFAIFFLLASVSCSTKDAFYKGIKGTWKVTKIELAQADRETQDIFKNSYLSFYNEGIITFFNGNDKLNTIYRLGRWLETKDGLNIALLHSSIELTFEIVELSDDWLLLKIINGPKETLGSVLKCQPWNTYHSESFDLFNPSNNAWRIKPNHLESTDQIKERVLSHLNFLLGYFEMVKQNDLGYFEPSMLQTPFQFYSNGIGLTNDFERTHAWTSNFYNDENALDGAKMLVEALQSIEAYPADERSYTQGYYNAIKMMRDFIEK